MIRETEPMSEIGEYVELTGENLPNHLRFDGTDVKAQCSACKRWTWAESEFGQKCRMPQPDSSLCVGRFADPGDAR